MNINEFELVKEKLEKYNLVDEIENISKWFRRLKDKHIKNFLNLNYNDHLKKYNKLLVNIGFLNSNTYLDDVDLLEMYNDKDIDVDEITNLLTDPVFINSPYHNKDLDFILDVDDKKTRKYLIELARSTISINSKYHEEDMRYLYSVISVDTEQKRIKKDKYKLYENFVDYAIKHSRLNIEVKDKIHETDSFMILGAKNIEMSDNLKETALNKYSLNSKYHKQDMGYIYNAEDNNISELLGKLARNKVSLESEYHTLSMDYLSRAKTHEQALLVYYLSTNKTMLLSDKYNSIVCDILNCSNTQVIHKLYYSIINNNLEYIAPYISLIINSSNDKFNMLCDLALHSDLFSHDMIVKFNNIKYFPAAQLYYKFFMKNMNYIGLTGLIFDKLNNLSDFEIYEFLSEYLNIDEKPKEEVIKEEDKLTNQEKLDLMYKNALKYVDDNKCNELPTKVFVIK